MIGRACWINYKPVVGDYWPIGCGFIRPPANASGMKLHMSHVHHAHVPGPSHPGGGYILSTVTHYSTEVKSCLTATRFEGHYTPDVRVEHTGLLSKFWHTAELPELVNRNVAVVVIKTFTHHGTINPRNPIINPINVVWYNIIIDIFFNIKEIILLNNVTQNFHLFHTFNDKIFI